MSDYLFRRVPMSDGVRLATDVWLPSGPGPFPVLLWRTPYHRAGTHQGVARQRVPWGYAVVVQDIRGKFDSEGEFRFLVNEARDGHETLDWIAEQSWCNGRIGLIGLSYMAMTQLPAASGGHPALRCIAPMQGANNFFRDWTRYDGCFALANCLRWALTWGACRTESKLNHFTWEELHGRKSLDEVFERVGFDSAMLRELVEHDTYDAYWQEIDQQRMYDSIAVPGLHVGGWFDHISAGQFQAFRGIREKGASDPARRGQRLVVGPWGHAAFHLTQYGEWDFGSQAAASFEQIERPFLDHWMKDEDNGLDDSPPVRLFLLGENRWEHFTGWPPPESRNGKWFLRSGGNANGLDGDGGLTREGPDTTPSDSYLYDPRDPVPTHGGPIYRGLPACGPIDQHSILNRPDVLYYRSEPQSRPLTIVGDVGLELWIAGSAPDTDFVAKLCVVEPNDHVICLTVGSLRCRFRESWSEPRALEPGKPTRIEIRLGRLAYVFPEGSRVALIVTSSCFPRILPNPNTMAPTWKETSPQVARQEILHTREYPSFLSLPVLEPS